MTGAAVAVIVLAGGRGERLGGVCKAALTLGDGRSFVAAIVASARAVGVGRVIVVGARPWLAETRAAALAAGVAAADVVDNPAPERGMASSFAVGLAVLGGAPAASGGASAVSAAFAPVGLDAALAWPVDHPLVRVDTLAAIIAAARRDRVVVPVWAVRGGHPTAFGAELWPACQAAGRGGAPDGLRAVVRADPARVIRLTVDDGGVRRDVDTPDDYAKMKGA